MEDRAANNPQRPQRVKLNHREGTVGPWARQKLEALEAYLAAYMKVMKYQHFVLTYVDAFAGLGISKVRRPEALDDGSETLLGMEDKEDADEFILGSPLRALSLDRPFDRYHFIERDPRRVQVLAELKGQFPSRRISTTESDANEAVQQIARAFVAKNERGVAFLDPYGAHLHWKTISALAATGKFDVIINFPLDMAINRLLRNDCKLLQSTHDQLDLCFGTNAWFDEAYEQAGGLFGDQLIKRSDARNRLLKLYVDRLKDAFGNVAGPSLVRNTRGSPLYHLVWASSNHRGLPIAKHILSLGQADRISR